MSYRTHQRKHLRGTSLANNLGGPPMTAHVEERALLRCAEPGQTAAAATWFDSAHGQQRPSYCKRRGARPSAVWGAWTCICGFRVACFCRRTAAPKLFQASKAHSSAMCGMEHARPNAPVRKQQTPNQLSHDPAPAELAQHLVLRRGRVHPRRVLSEFDPKRQRSK